MADAQPVYLDHLATTPVDPAVLAAMADALREHFGNASSGTHAYGWSARALAENARAEVAALAGCEPREVVFTSGATEANNLALRGTADLWPQPGRIVTTTLEHSSVDRTLDVLEARGWRVVRVPCGPDGLVPAAAVADALTDDTRLVAINAAQNEIGTLQPWARIAQACRERGIVCHVDAAQAAGKVPLDFRADGIGLLALSAHKIYGPKGAGALVVRAREPRVELRPQITGGGQERGLRAGTLNVPAVVGMGVACRLALARREQDAARLRRLGARLYARLADRIGDLVLNGDARARLPGCLNLLIPGVPSGALMRAVPTLAFSAGAACTSGEGKPSAALLALGLDPDRAACCIRLSLGRGTTEAEAAAAADRLADAITAIRKEKGTA
ncbi:MAG: cysteine desulfurase [bacterium]|nr:cysteine desulfurase [bacterium]